MSDLLDLELATLYVRTPDGRLERERRITLVAPPLVAVARGAHGLVTAYSTTLPDSVAAEVERLLRDGPDEGDGVPEVGWSPRHADAILALLPDAGSRQVGTGPSYVSPPSDRATPASPPADVELRTSDDTDLESLAPLLPERDRVLDPPWVVALVDDGTASVAAVCETARSAPAAVEAGVWTYEPHRRRGLASVVTARWLDLVTPERTAFYSTDADNLGSQGVARRLGLTRLGQWWQVRSGAEN